MIKLTDIWIAVPVERELPEYYNDVTVIDENGLFKTAWRANDGDEDIYTISSSNVCINPTHFLRHPTLAELLQVEGMRDILKEIFQNGYNRACHEERGGGGHVYSFETTYNNLLNK
jgi:hypothetical protein